MKALHTSRSCSAFAMLAIATLTLASGCATYVRDRVADAGDIFTATVGTGIGVTAKAGPIHTGLGSGMDLYGLRGGEVGSFVPSKYDSGPCGDFSLAFVSAGGFAPSRPRAHARGKTSYSAFWDDEQKLLPLLDLPWNSDAECHPVIDPQWTQLDLSVGFFASVRLGFNPGELLDFALGLFGLDLYGDDLVGAGADWETLAQKKREKDNAKRRAARQRKYHFEEWAGKELTARRDWHGWQPNLVEASRIFPHASVMQEDGNAWRVFVPLTGHYSSWSNTWHVIVRVRDTPAAARSELMATLEASPFEMRRTIRRDDKDLPGDVSFFFTSHQAAFVRDCLFVSIDSHTYGHDDKHHLHLAQFARAIDAQILAAIEEKK